MSEYLTKEEIKKWRSSVEKITLEEYAARLGKKIQEEKKTNDLADMLYTHFNPAQSPANYDTVTKLEKIDLTPKLSPAKNKKHSAKVIDEIEDLDLEEDFAIDEIEEIEAEKPAPKEKKIEKKVTKEVVSKEKKTISKKEKADDISLKDTAPKKKKTVVAKKEKAVETNSDFGALNITFKKPLTDREEKVLGHFLSKRGEIVYAKDLAELLDLKRDYIYKYIKNLRAKMSTDIIVNADNGGFKLN